MGKLGGGGRLTKKGSKGPGHLVQLYILNLESSHGTSPFEQIGYSNGMPKMSLIVRAKCHGGIKCGAP